MCARYTLTAEEKEILKANPLRIVGDYTPDPNIAVTERGLVITSDEPDIIQVMNFGIIPQDNETPILTYDTWNVRSEEVMDKSTYRPLMHKKQTCLILMDGFYEPEHVSDTDNRPWRFLTERKIFCVAGIWDEWTDPITGEKHRTFAMMTCKANKTVGEVHDTDRMVVILPKAWEDIWLNKKSSIETLISLCVPYPDSKMNRYRVDKKANRVSTKLRPNKDMSLLDPVEDEPRQESLFNNDELPVKKPIERRFKDKPKKSQDKKKPEQPPELDLFS